MASDTRHSDRSTRHLSRISATFARLRAEGRVGLGPYLTIGFPELDSALELATAIARGGADMVELGIPFSDPLADGPTIQRSSERALENGVSVRHCLETARRLRERIDIPMIFMGYYNPLLAYGLDRFVADAASAGADGLIVPDVPPVESDDLLSACRRHGLDLILMLAPTSTDEDIREVARRASGFIYCVSVVGITGARETVSAGLPGFLSRVRAATDLPLAVGFGVSRAEHVAQIGQLAEAAIVGAALIGHIENAAPGQEAAEVETFVAGLRPEHVST